MDRAEQAASLLPHVARLAEEHGPALKRAHTLLLDGALTGPAGQRLQKTLADQHEDVRAAFYAAFDSVRQVAAGAGPPRVREPYIPGPPRGGRSASAARSGSPDALDQLSTELTRTANSWEDAAQALSEILANLGLSTAPARTISRAAQTVSDQKPAIRRSREELLKTDQAVQPAKTGNVLHDGWNAYVHHYLPGLGQGVKDIGLSALAGNPMTAPFYIAIKPKGWLERGPVGQIQGLAQGVQHPIAFAKAAVNWEEWKRDPVRAFGEAAPTIVITAVTGGTGSGSGVAARLAAALRRTGKSETAASTRALQEAAAEAPKTKDLARQTPKAIEDQASSKEGAKTPKDEPEGTSKRGILDESSKVFNDKERAIANLLIAEGHDVTALLEASAKGVRTPDALVDGVPVEFKSLKPGARSNTIKNRLNDAKGQSGNVILDARGTGLAEQGAQEGIELFLRHNPGRMDNIRIIGDGYEVTWP